MDKGMGRPGTPYDDIPDPSPFSEEVLGALESLERAQEEIRQSSEVLRGAFTKVVAFYFPVGAVVQKWDKRAGRLVVVVGSAYQARAFRIDSKPFVDLSEKNPIFSRWTATASPLNSKGEPMKRQCKIRLPVFPRADDPSQEKLSDADRILTAIDDYERAVYEATCVHAQNSHMEKP